MIPLNFIHKYFSIVLAKIGVLCINSRDQGKKYFEVEDIEGSIYL